MAVRRSSFGIASVRWPGLVDWQAAADAPASMLARPSSGRRLGALAGVLVGAMAIAPHADARTVFGGAIGPGQGPFGLELNALPGQELPSVVGRVEFVVRIRCDGSRPDLQLRVGQRIVAAGTPRGNKELRLRALTSEGTIRASGTTDYRFGGAQGRVAETLRGRIVGNRATGTFRAVARLVQPGTGGRVARCRSRRVHWRARSAPGRIFAGLTSTGHPVTLKVGTYRGHVRRMQVLGRCAGSERPMAINWWTSLPIRPDGRFRGGDRWRFRDGGVLERGRDRVRGRISGDRASGSWSTEWMARARDGSVTRCRVDPAHWFVRSTPERVMPSRPGPRFSLERILHVGENPFRMVTADLNADGAPDLATVNWLSATVSVLFGTGAGGFAEPVSYATPRRPQGIAAGDMNGDGSPDLVTASFDRAGSLSVFVNRGGRFEPAGTYASGRQARAVATGDLNADGIVDAVAANEVRGHLVVLLGQHAGNFRLAHRYTGPPASDVALGDLDRDGDLDVVLAASGRNSVVVRLGSGDGAFGPVRSYRSGFNPFDVTLADINHDDMIDVAVANYGNGNLSQDFQFGYGSVSALLGAGDGTFGPPMEYPTGSGSSVDAVAVTDFDADGNVDIAAPDWVGPIVRRGRGDGTFLRQLNVRRGLCTGGGIAVADYNGDRLPDLAISGTCHDESTSSVVHVLLNRTGQPCAVPDLRSQPLRVVPVVLNGAGCRLRRVGYLYSRQQRTALVISQDPPAGATLPIDTPVDVVVSRGRRR
jgi:hypothetical protein